MATFNESNTGALGFFSGFAQGLSPALINAYRTRKGREDEKAKQQRANDLAIFKQGQENNRANAKLKAEKQLAAGKADRARSDFLLKAKLDNAKLVYETGKKAEQAGLDRENDLEVARLRHPNSSNYYGLKLSGGYTPQDLTALENIAKNLSKFKVPTHYDSRLMETIPGNEKELQEQQRKLYAAIEAIKSDKKLTESEQAFVSKILSFGEQPPARLEPPGAPEYPIGVHDYIGQKRAAEQPQAQVPQAQVPQAQVPQAQVPQAQVPQAQVPQAQAPISAGVGNAWSKISPVLKDSVIKALGTTAGEASKKWNSLPPKERARILQDILKPAQGYNPYMARSYLQNQPEIPEANYNNTTSSGNIPVEDW